MNKKKQLWSLIDKTAISLTMIVGIILIIIQVVLLINPGVSSKLNTALRLEGEPLKEAEIIELAGGISTTPWASLSLRLVDYVSLPELKVLVNGKIVSDFLHREVTIPVKNGDIISIQGNRDLYYDVEICKKTPNIKRPLIESRVSGKGIQVFSSVVIK